MSPSSTLSFTPTHTPLLLLNNQREAQTIHTYLINIVLCLDIELVLNKRRREISKAGKGRRQDAL